MGQRLDIAIVGLAGCYPKAADTRAFWRNIVAGVDAVDDADDAWSGPYLDPASDANDRIYTRRGGFLRELAEVDPLSFNVLPNTAEGGDPDHLIALKHAAAALRDAGYGPQRRQHRPERSGVVIGRGTYGNRGLASVLARGLFLDQAMDIARALRPDLDETRLAALREHFRSQLPLYNADMVGPLTPNVIAGLIANRLDLMGPSFIVDAACASTLIALDGALRELDSGRCDLMLAGGVHSHTPPQLFIQFCQIKALSRDRIRPFQQGSEGTLLGEGVGMLALKRREDAEADGDRIYALIRGIGTSSDGRAKGLLAPRREGQVEALRAAYAGSGIDPATIGLIEAHGTGTAIGDLTEIQTLQEVFGELGAGPRIALGSVKSMIGHCLPAAGSASLIKTALALHQRVLPATLCETPDPRLELETTPFYINNRSRPWIHGESTPRRAAVNAFGFGGANAHVILEEYRPPQKRVQVSVLDAPSDDELLLFGADSPAALIVAVRAALAHLRTEKPPDLGDLAGACAKAAAGDHRLAVLAGSNAEAAKRLEQALERLEGSPRPFRTRAGLYYGHGPAPGKLCFLFPGEGSQYPDMLEALTRQYAPLREWFDFIEQGARARGDASRAEALFPAPTGLTDSARAELEQRLYSMEPAAESLFAAGLGLHAVLGELGLRADGMLGHSTGENTAIIASGLLRSAGADELAGHLRALNQIARELQEELPQGTLLTVGALRPARRAALISNPAPLRVAMDNCPNQLVLFGEPEAAEALRRELAEEGAVCAELPFGRPYHTELFKPVADAYRALFRDMEFGAGQCPLYSACSAAPFPDDADGIRELAARQWECPVRFVETVERLYQDGYRVFLEVGPSANLTGFVGDVLRQREDVLALSCDSRRRPGLRHFQQTLAQLYVAGVPLDPAALFAHRELRPVDLAQPPQRPGRMGIRLDRGMPVLRVPDDFPPPPVAQAPATPRNTPTPSPDAPAPADPRLALLQGHFDLMNDFLQSQSRMLERLRGRGAAAPEPPSGPAPLLGTVIRRDARSLEAERRFTAHTDPFLADHAIGSAPSPRQPELTALRVIPFTFSMELVAEAAAALDDAGGVLLAIEDARGHRWLALDRRQLELRTRVERLDDVAGARLFRVRVFQLGEQGPGGAALVFEALVRRGSAAPAAPAPQPWPAAAERPIRNSINGELYAHGMFHGPRLQGVRHLRRWGAQEIEADLEVLPRHDYFAEAPNPLLQLDPALLDAAGQLIAYWLVEQPGRWGFNCFPFRVGRYTQYAPPPPAGTRVLCRCFLKPPADDSRLRADLDFVDTEGRLLARVEDWEDRKFAVPERYYAFRLDPHGHALSEALEAPPELSLRRLEFFEPGFLDQGWGVWKRMLAHMALDSQEREAFYALPAAGGRREEWLMGRLAVKDAVRDWLRRHYGLTPAPADIRIQSDAHGAPRVLQVLGLPPSATLPRISISHAGRTALAACAGSDVGVDYQPVAGHDVEALISGAFSATEQALLDRLPLARSVLAVALWSAKEAAAKAGGAGLGGRPQDWQVTAAELDPSGGRVAVDHQGRAHEVRLRLDGDAVTALCLEPAGVLEDS